MTFWDLLDKQPYLSIFVVMIFFIAVVGIIEIVKEFKK